jgi:hypothetical protein
MIWKFIQLLTLYFFACIAGFFIGVFTTRRKLLEWVIGKTKKEGLDYKEVMLLKELLEKL